MNVNGWNNKCDHHVKPMPPQPPFRPSHCPHDSYSHDCYHEFHGHPMPHELPTHGPMLGSGFMLINYEPYLFDSTHVKFGNFINVAENINTRISRRRDESCINLDAVFNLTGQVMRNIVMQQHLEKSIGCHFEELQGILPIIKSDITLRLYYTVEDDMGGVVHQAVLTTTTPHMNLHYTDIRDYFVTSLKSIFVANIPAMDYTGMYKLILHKIEVYVDTLDIKSKMDGNVNPYYQFADNNNRIILQHDSIQSEIPDGSLLIASSQINEMIPFQANVTTRLRISFISYLSELICVPQTYGIWSQLFEPSDEKLDRLMDEMVTMKESINMINHTLDRLQNGLTDLTFRVETNEQNIENLQTQLTDLGTRMSETTSDLEARVDDLDYRVTVLENRPQAIVKYKTGIEYTPGQITYNEFGEMYQVAKTFTATTLEDDITNGNIVSFSIDDQTLINNVNMLLQDVQELRDADQRIIQQIGNIESSIEKVDKELEFYTSDDFPEVGEPNTIYVDKANRKSYIWDDEAHKYTPIVSDWDATVIQSDLGD